ncbi:MAG: hypothetical protein AAF493_29770 [Pseudomonadota bacterium]
MNKLVDRAQCRVSVFAWLRMLIIGIGCLGVANAATDSPGPLAAVMGVDERFSRFDTGDRLYLQRASRVGLVSSKFAQGAATGVVVCQPRIVVTSGHIAGALREEIVRRIPYWDKLNEQEKMLAKKRWFLASRFSFSLATPKRPGLFRRGILVSDVYFGTNVTGMSPNDDFAILLLDKRVHHQAVPLSLPAFDPQANESSLPPNLYLYALHSDVGYDRETKKLIANPGNAHRANVVIESRGRTLRKARSGPHLQLDALRDWYLHPHIALVTWDATFGASGAAGFFEDDGRDYLLLIHKGEFRARNLQGSRAANPIFHFNTAVVTAGHRKFYEMMAQATRSTVQNVHKKCARPKNRTDKLQGTRAKERG